MAAKKGNQHASEQPDSLALLVQELAKMREDAAKRDAEHKDEIAKLNAEHKEETKQLRQESASLNETVKQFQTMIFGSSSEKSKYKQVAGQLALEFLGDSLRVEDAVPEPTIEELLPEQETEQTKPKAPKKPRSKRADLISTDVPREKRVIPLSEEQSTCDECGAELSHLGEEFDHSEVEIVPAQVKVIDYYRETAICKKCKKNGNTQLKKSTPPMTLLAHSLASPVMVAYIIYMKYVNAVPLNRMEADFIRMGIRLDRSVQANWVNTCVLTYLKPLFDYLYEELMKREVLMSDETTCQVHREKDKKNQSKSFMWLYRSGEDGLPPIILFEYQPGRNGEYAERFLADFSRYHHCDGYSGYNGVSNVTRIACLAHIRRKFVDAIPADRTGNKLSSAEEGVLFCNKLFSLEREYKEKPPEDLKETRLKYSKPVLEAFWKWLDKQDPPGGSNLYKAVNYARNQKEYMNNFLLDGHLSISNALSENTIRPYTEHVLTEMQGYNGKPDGIERFQPWNKEIQQLCGSKPIKNG